MIKFKKMALLALLAIHTCSYSIDKETYMLLSLTSAMSGFVVGLIGGAIAAACKYPSSSKDGEKTAQEIKEIKEKQDAIISASTIGGMLLGGIGSVAWFYQYLPSARMRKVESFIASSAFTTPSSTDSKEVIVNSITLFENIVSHAQALDRAMKDSDHPSLMQKPSTLSGASKEPTTCYNSGFTRSACKHPQNCRMGLAAKKLRKEFLSLRKSTIDALTSLIETDTSNKTYKGRDNTDALVDTKNPETVAHFIEQRAADFTNNKGEGAEILFKLCAHHLLAPKQENTSNNTIMYFDHIPYLGDRRLEIPYLNGKEVPSFLYQEPQ